MDRDRVLAIIDQAYQARIRGDAAALAGLWAEGGTFELVGEGALLESFPAGDGPAPGQPAVEALIGLVTFLSAERLHAVVEGLNAATVSRVKASFAGQPAFDTLFCDVWELGEDGRIRSLRQFADTARVAAEMRQLNR